jgi:hypothetical protein
MIDDDGDFCRWLVSRRGDEPFLIFKNGANPVRVV